MVVSQALVRASRRMAFWSKVAVGVAPLATIALFLFPDEVREVGGAFSITAHYARLLTDAVPLSDRLVALGIALVPTVIAMWGILSLARLFEAFAQGEIFSPRSLSAVTNIAAALFWNVLASLATEPAISWFLHHGDMQLTLGYDDLELLFLAGVAYVIARAMAEAKNLAEENAAFV